MERTSPQIYVGTMGFSYSDWAGTFYPAGTKPGDYLQTYATSFDAVELDTTFHAVPPIDRVRRWADVTPAHFRFCVKTPKDITHVRSPENAVEPMKAFIGVVRELGPKLAVVLLQYPPSFGFDNANRLAKLLETLPKDLRFAIEFRNNSWWRDETTTMLRAHHCCWVAGDYDERPTPVRATADFLYVRMVGVHHRFPVLSHEQLDVTDRLQWWKQQIADAPPYIRRAWVMVNNDFSGYAIATAQKFRKMLGQQFDATPGSLFK